ncbi:MAG: endonuclease/exonuclease/phosphatase family protein [Bacteroidetes bacterium]|jgi:endonuclease/exonuclease/phosphatase family metal-dependent hydrolase|nr:endonuclease/exonuclease/phosphatase family protein [Bacteroidota bacterium]MDF1868071.1 endonuclease/exonuclease/phosphatase family protein [Saprospiraceae bacterium]
MKITDVPPKEIREELKRLEEDLDYSIPAKRLDENLIIGSWNIRAFGNLTRKWVSEDGDSPKRDMHSLLCIAEILKRFDVVALQEVKGNIRALRDLMKLLGRNWGMILTDVSRGAVGNNERMAYLFDTRRVQLSGLACELVVPDEWLSEINEDALRKQFVRTPYGVGFRSNDQTFVLVTLHVLYGKSAKERIPELKAIADWLANWAKDANSYDQNLITLGDFNIEARGDLLHQTFISSGLYVPPELQRPEVTRSIFNETKYYDQIAWFNGENDLPELSLNFLQGGNYDFVGKVLMSRNLTKHRLSFHISDHYPLWAEFALE